MPVAKSRSRDDETSDQTLSNLAKNGWKKMSPEENVRHIGNSHFDYLIVHPFADGNGRSSRALTYFMYRFAGIESFVFTSSDRYETYYRCINDPEDMALYFLGRTTFTNKRKSSSITTPLGGSYNQKHTSYWYAFSVSGHRPWRLDIRSRKKPMVSWKIL